MWNNYFYNIQKKYSMRVSTKEPLVIRLDGKDVTKNKNIDLINRLDNSFLDALEKSVAYFSSLYNCYAIYGSDEVSFIFPEPFKVIEDLSSDKCTSSNEIISVFSQYFFQYFNHFDKHKIVYWHAKCFSIREEKLISYIKYRSRIIENVLATYFLKHNHISIGNVNLEEKLNKCKSLENYSSLEKIQKGILYYNGKEIILNDFLNGKVTYAKSQNTDDMFSSLL